MVVTFRGSGWQHVGLGGFAVAGCGYADCESGVFGSKVAVERLP